MPEMVYDAKTKQMVPLTEMKKAQKTGHVRMSLNKALADKVLAFAVADKIDMTAKTDTGKKVRATNTLRKYIEIAVGEWIEAREAIASSTETE